MLDITEIRDAFAQHYGVHPRLMIRAPGRVNLIGEHTDYNDGFVFPVAIDRATYVAARPRDDRYIHVTALDVNETDIFDLDAPIERSQQYGWSNYVRGVVKGLLAAGHTLTGANMVFLSDVPRGAGLSSSAALEVSVGYTFQVLNRLNILGEELALLAQGAENTFVGVKCGIMDQFISALGRADHALMIDCRNLTARAVPLPHDAKVVICDSGVRHELGTSEYNVRRAQCEQAVHVLKGVLPHITALRDVTLADLEAHGHLLDAVVLRRARHVCSENERVLASVDALEQGDYTRFGQLMNASHTSMRDDYEISAPEIDVLVEIGQALPGCYGSRMTGGGFGGCTVSLVENSAVEAFQEQLKASYLERTGKQANIYICAASDGVGRAIPEE
ncbi:galactokinase [Chloroflexia bacterium SDU3-3]|nr:galactokinase [Chloroflexia bacterium SDU3-3]